MKESLCVLIKYGLVTFKPNRNANIANYVLQSDHVLLMIRYPKYISLIKSKFGDEGEIILEEVLQKGYATASDLLLKAAAKLKKDQEKAASLSDLRDKLQSLIVAKYLRRVPKCDEETPVPVCAVNETDQYTMPLLDLKQLVQIQNGSNEEATDAGVYWTANFDRFHQDMRDKIIVNAISKKFDENTAELMRIFLQQMYIRTGPWVDVSNPIPVFEVKDFVKKMNTHPQLVAFFDQYVSILGKYLQIKWCLLDLLVLLLGGYIHFS